MFKDYRAKGCLGFIGFRVQGLALAPKLWKELSRLLLVKCSPQTQLQETPTSVMAC